ncbi:MAG: uridine kinase [Clostridiaceae bacterium]|jgi:uridine kinase|nr:uridine kinase [Clostridiaceae bacterium]
MDKITVVGVAGGSASGKTTIIEKLRVAFPDDMLVMSHDDYYKAHHDLSLENRAKLNYDHPNAYDTDLFIEHLEALIRADSIKRPVYDYTVHNRSSEEVIVQPKKIIVIDGILILENQALRELMDIKIFVDADADERLIRRIKRDTLERGRSLGSVLEQYRNSVKPMHDQFVEPSKKYADIIIPYGGRNQIAVNMLIEIINRRIK